MSNSKKHNQTMEYVLYCSIEVLILQHLIEVPNNLRLHLHMWIKNGLLSSAMQTKNHASDRKHHTNNAY